ncbi:MAG: hypothetical protein LBF49_03085 [Puniceicoccales bacterium]|jgi:hypothetical protein|nr:hypothetical protein [Puniceicoccales bacterium]
MDTNTSVAFSTIPDDNYVKNLRDKGFDVHVFQRTETRVERMGSMGVEREKKRRIVAIKFPYTQGPYYTYDNGSEYHGMKLFPKILTEREVEALRNDPTFTHEGPPSQKEH